MVNFLDNPEKYCNADVIRLVDDQVIYAVTNYGRKCR